MATSIRIDGLAETIVEIRDLPEKVERRVILDMSQIAYDTIQQGAGRHRGSTGALFQSLYNRSVSPLARQVGHDSQRAPHAQFVIHGTRPHIIRPKDKKALRWVMGNRFIFAKFVRHPGNKADNYIDRAADDAVRQFSAIVDRATKEA
jgi:hypothetical protein